MLLGEVEPEPLPERPPLRVAGLFAGIGGIEVGLSRSGHESRLLCDIDAGARAVLGHHFPEADIHDDVTTLESLPAIDLLSAGFPCQDLSQAGKTKGIKGEQSGLVEHVFRLFDTAPEPPTWLLMENVPFMLSLAKGEAMKHVTNRLSDMGFMWAYRVVDTRAFGIPQRRRRVIMLASREEDPRTILFADESDDSHLPEDGTAFGFYWTEGRTGVGWGIESIPPLKKGSTLGIPSAPAIWFTESGLIGNPDIRDAERLQGFDADWTKPAATSGATTERGRWRYVGNAVSVPVAEWLGERFRKPIGFHGRHKKLGSDARLPLGAAWGRDGEAYEVEASNWPVQKDFEPLSEFLRHPIKPLSIRASSGFLSRARKGTLNIREDFLEAVEAHIEWMATQE